MDRHGSGSTSGWRPTGRATWPGHGAPGGRAGAARDLADSIPTALTSSYLGLVASDAGDHAAAAARFAAALPLAGGRHPGDAGRVAGRGGDPGRGLRSVAGAARLFGAAEALRDALGHAFTLPERAAFDRAPARRAPRWGRRLRRRPGGRPRVAAQQVLAEAVRSLPRSPAAAFGAATGTRPCGEAAGLTPRELDVLRLLAAGRSDREIAEALFIGPRTVQTHVANLAAKLGVRGRAEAAVVAVRRGLV